MSAKTKKIINIVGNTLIWLFVAFSIATTALVFIAQGAEDGIPEIFGKSWITIQTGSMEPTFNIGDLVFMDKLDDAEKNDLKVGDIITYSAPIDINQDGQTGDINTHRIVEIDHETGIIQTRGDYDGAIDDIYQITKNDVIGICHPDSKADGIGGVIDFLRSSVGFFVCVVLPLAMFFIYELYNFITLLVSERQKRQPVEKETEEEIKRKAIEEYLAQQKALEDEVKASEAAPSSEEENK